MIALALSNIFWYIAFQVYSALSDVNFLSDSHMSAVLRETLSKWLIIPRITWSSFFVFGDGMSVNAFSFHGSDCTSCLEITSPINGTDVHLKWHLSLLSLKFT